MTCPLGRYWICHAVAALGIGIALWPLLGLPAGLMIGAGFYTVREIVQWRSGLPFDWPGLLAPVIACAAALMLYEIAGATGWPQPWPPPAPASEASNQPWLFASAEFPKPPVSS
jgi:hypothetical protein